MKEILYDLLLKGGHVIDPAANRSSLCDVATKDGKIAAVAPNIPAYSAAQTIDVTGLYITPGLIDMHTHIYPSWPTGADGLKCINPDAHLFQQGVTTVVDAGTCGIRDFVQFKEAVIDVSALRVLAMINIADGGMVTLASEQRLSEFRPQAVAGMAKSFPDIVVAIKTAHYWVGKPFTTEHPPWASVDATLEAGELSGLPAMFDFQPTLPERSYQDLVLQKMRKGDIHTHMYAQQFPVINEQGHVSDFLFEAKARGVLFDLGHGAGSFWFRNAIPAFRESFVPDTLSTDLYFDNVAGPVIGLSNILSKYLNIGMALEEVVARCTVAPAKVLHHPELGTLSVGACADIAVLNLREGAFGFADAGRARMAGTKRLECMLTVREGRIVYDPEALALPDWETADASYWVSPGVLPKPY